MLAALGMRYARAQPQRKALPVRAAEGVRGLHRDARAAPVRRLCGQRHTRGGLATFWGCHACAGSATCHAQGVGSTAGAGRCGRVGSATSAGVWAAPQVRAALHAQAAARRPHHVGGAAPPSQLMGHERSSTCKGQPCMVPQTLCPPTPPASQQQRLGGTAQGPPRAARCRPCEGDAHWLFSNTAWTYIHTCIQSLQSGTHKV